VKRYHFTAEQFTQHFSQTDIGASYSIWIPWDAVGGDQMRISLVPSFRTAAGKVVQGDQALVGLPGRRPAGADQIAGRPDRASELLAQRDATKSGLTTTTIPVRREFAHLPRAAGAAGATAIAGAAPRAHGPLASPVASVNEPQWGWDAPSQEGCHFEPDEVREVTGFETGGVAPFPLPGVHDVLIERTDPTVTRHQLDTGNTAMAGRDPLEYMARFGSRYWLFHIKDVPRFGATSDTKRFELTDARPVGDGITILAYRRA
jgi:hypothetical protein